MQHKKSMKQQTGHDMKKKKKKKKKKTSQRAATRPYKGQTTPEPPF